jgi:hypothetical protein
VLAAIGQLGDRERPLERPEAGYQQMHRRRLTGKVRRAHTLIRRRAPEHAAPGHLDALRRRARDQLAPRLRALRRRRIHQPRAQRNCPRAYARDGEEKLRLAAIANRDHDITSPLSAHSFSFQAFQKKPHAEPVEALTGNHLVAY